MLAQSDADVIFENEGVLFGGFMPLFVSVKSSEMQVYITVVVPRKLCRVKGTQYT